MGGVGGCGQGRGARVAGKAGVSRGALGNRVSGATPKSYRKSYRQIVSAETLFWCICSLPGDAIWRYDFRYDLGVARFNRYDFRYDYGATPPDRYDFRYDSGATPPDRYDFRYDSGATLPDGYDFTILAGVRWGGVGARWGWDRGVYCILCDCACQASRRKNVGTVGQV